MQRRVVITGMGAIAPTGHNVLEIWESALLSKHAIGPITKFDTKDLKTKIAAEIKDFDALNYMEKSEARKMDLFSQYALAAAKEAIEDSKLHGAIDPTRFGVYVGSGIGGMNTFTQEFEKLQSRGPKRVSVFFIPMLISNMAAGHIAIKYGAKGPCVPTVSACSTSATAIGEAYRVIKHGYADAILAGGAEAAITPIGLAGFINMGAVTTTEDVERASIPFDKDRSGFVMGEGAALVVLEDYDHAKNRGATIYAEMLGYGSTCDAYHITAPDPEAKGATRAIIDSLPERLSETLYVNAHGTSTPLNDVLETKALKQAFGDKASSLHISSTKSMTGHLLGAAGALESIFCIKALETGWIPPTVGLKYPDDQCNLNYTPEKAVEVHPQMALSLSLGFGGHNASLCFGRLTDES